MTAHIQSMKDNQQDNEIQYVIREYLLKNTNIEIPDSMIERSVTDELNRLTEALKAYNVTVEDYLKQTGSNLENFLKNTRERTLMMIKTRYIYRKLLEENKISLTADEISQIQKVAKTKTK